VVLDTNAALDLHISVVLLADEAVEEGALLISLVAAVLLNSGQTGTVKDLIETDVVILGLGERFDFGLTGGV